MEGLVTLEQNVDLLLTRVREQQERIVELEGQNASLREEILRSHSELADLQRQFRHLQDAHAMMGSEVTRTQARNHINYLITQIDQALEVLKS